MLHGMSKHIYLKKYGKCMHTFHISHHISYMPMIRIKAQRVTNSLKSEVVSVMLIETHGAGTDLMEV